MGTIHTENTPPRRPFWRKPHAQAGDMKGSACGIFKELKKHEPRVWIDNFTSAWVRGGSYRTFEGYRIVILLPDDETAHMRPYPSYKWPGTHEGRSQGQCVHHGRLGLFCGESAMMRRMRASVVGALFISLVRPAIRDHPFKVPQYSRRHFRRYAPLPVQ